MKKKLTVRTYIWKALFIGLVSTAIAIVPNQFDNFEDGTNQGWGSGGSNPTPHSNVDTGGPDGENDNYLRVISNGGSGPGSKLVVNNATQWSGDYLTAGVQFVSMHIKNFSNSTLNMRIALRGSGGDFWSIDPLIIQPLSDWQPVTFSVQAINLTGGTNVNSTLSNVSNFRIIHSAGGGYSGSPVLAQIGLDNISAASLPIPVELNSFAASISGKKVKLSWSTSSETNNMSFEIQRRFLSADWHAIGKVSGNGTTAQKQYYTFSDDVSDISSSKIQYRLKQYDFNGSFTYSYQVAVSNGNALTFELSQNYPNPFNPSTKIKFSIPAGEKVQIKIYNTAGNEVVTLLNEFKEAGLYEIQLNAEDWASGVYYYKVTAGNHIATKKMLLVK